MKREERRDESAKGRRDEGAKGRRDESSKGRRDESAKGRRDESAKGLAAKSRRDDILLTVDFNLRRVIAPRSAKSRRDDTSVSILITQRHAENTQRNAERTKSLCGSPRLLRAALRDKKFWSCPKGAFGHAQRGLLISINN